MTLTDRKKRTIWEIIERRLVRQRRWHARELIELRDRYEAELARLRAELANARQTQQTPQTSPTATTHDATEV